MKTITVNASKSYNVLIGSGLMDQTGTHLLSIQKACKCAIISDSNVWPLYGNKVRSSLENNGFEAVEFVFEAGEASKCMDTYIQILNFLAQNHITRSDIVIALGGGVTGDMAGFAAATFLRGVSYVQIPTSLLAMVDSSVGGKTAIDLPVGKNLVGAFCQPSLVLCDIDALDTLPEEVFRDGCAEVIKYGVLYSKDLFEHLEANALKFNREDVITHCVELKRDVVALDEFDTGERQKLNLGHTLGHCIEAESNFTVSHGQAVAIGMCMIAKAGTQLGITEKQITDRIPSILQSFGLPTKTAYSAPVLTCHAMSDKKRTGGTVNLIIPKTIGCCVTRATPVEQLEQIIESGL